MKVEALAERLRKEFGEGGPSSPSSAWGHSKALDAASRLLGAGGSWHEASRSGAKKERDGDGKGRPLRAEGSGAGFGFDAWAEPEGPWFALAALAKALPAPEGWTAGAWAGRARDMWGALAPALEEKAAREKRKVSAADCVEAASWAGIGALRLDEGLSEGARSALGRWARPWHSAFAPEPEDFKPVAEAWRGALEWLEEAASRSEGLEEGRGKVRVDAESDFSCALAAALCSRAGLSVEAGKGASKTMRSWFKSES